MFGKTMRIEDGVMGAWFELLTDVERSEREALLRGHFRAAKARLAEEVASLVWGRERAQAAGRHFDRVFRDKEAPEDVPERAWSWGEAAPPLAVWLRELGLAASSSEARRLIDGGGVKLDGAVCRDAEHKLPRPAAPLLLQVGKRRFLRLV